jgi:hypothetical protein
MVTDLNNGDSSASVLMSLPAGYYCTTTDKLLQFSFLWNLGTDRIENTVSNSSSVAACGFIAMSTCLFAKALLSNSCKYLLIKNLLPSSGRCLIVCLRSLCSSGSIQATVYWNKDKWFGLKFLICGNFRYIDGKFSCGSIFCHWVYLPLIRICPLFPVVSCCITSASTFPHWLHIKLVDYMLLKPRHVSILQDPLLGVYHIKGFRISES